MYDFVKRLLGNRVLRRFTIKSWFLLAFQAALTHPNCGKIYLTEIQKTFTCDTFFPNIDKQQFQLVNEEDIPEEKQSEGEISYFFRVYKRL